MTKKLPPPEALAAASARLSELMRQGGHSYLAEMQRRAVTPEQDNDPCVRAPEAPGDFDNVLRVRDALEVALVLLNELLELMPLEPDCGYALEVAEVFQEIGDIAANGEQVARQAATGEED